MGGRLRGDGGSTGRGSWGACSSWPHSPQTPGAPPSPLQGWLFPAPSSPSHLPPPPLPCTGHQRQLGVSLLGGCAHAMHRTAAAPPRAALTTAPKPLPPGPGLRQHASAPPARGLARLAAVQLEPPPVPSAPPPQPPSAPASLTTRRACAHPRGAPHPRSTLSASPHAPHNGATPPHAARRTPFERRTSVAACPPPPRSWRCAAAHLYSVASPSCHSLQLAARPCCLPPVPPPCRCAASP